MKVTSFSSNLVMLMTAILTSFCWFVPIEVSSFSVGIPSMKRSTSLVIMFAEPSAGKDTDINSIKFESEEEKKEAVGNLVADDEWMGLGMELSEVIRVAVIEDLKRNARDFLGKDEYRVGDLSKEIDARVKDESKF